MDQLRFFNPYADIRHSENRLPHWQQQGAVYFVTFRLSDAIPARLLREWDQERATWLTLHPQPWSAEIEREYHTRFSGKIEQWLDTGHGSCILRRQDCGEIVDHALAHFEGVRMNRLSSVVMPNHVHALFVQHPEHSVDRLLQSWKSYTARQINTLTERSGSVWQRDYFDRLVRDEQHFANCVRYIRHNPAKARLTQNEYVLFESEFVKQIE